MLFLCGGKSAFKRDPISIGILLLSVCPWFPAESSDNKSHLQVRLSSVISAATIFICHGIFRLRGIYMPSQLSGDGYDVLMLILALISIWMLRCECFERYSYLLVSDARTLGTFV